ncbi:hypothetical protein NMG29_00435 [Streptomyces cocklensis]|uniref:hypothetical protein n=1 Tax=Actinacidiphila cocklensis TaxID=887465 RepID=UPI00203DA8EF|nr:hypothetical protein [Actinacidiphila cocklensis]MDD1056716.1 hypothetical protein [Actinacidiphila cocklensis]
MDVTDPSTGAVLDPVGVSVAVTDPVAANPSARAVAAARADARADARAGGRVAAGVGRGCGGISLRRPGGRARAVVPLGIGCSASQDDGLRCATVTSHGGRIIGAFHDRPVAKRPAARPL